MWGWGRLRELPQVNYNESSSSDDELNLPADAFNSPLNSPQQPVHTREGSPQLLAHPTLNDNVDERSGSSNNIVYRRESKAGYYLYIL